MLLSSYSELTYDELGITINLSDKKEVIGQSEQ